MLDKAEVWTFTTVNKIWSFVGFKKFENCDFCWKRLKPCVDVINKFKSSIATVEICSLILLKLFMWRPTDNLSALFTMGHSYAIICLWHCFLHKRNPTYNKITVKAFCGQTFSIDKVRKEPTGTLIVVSVLINMQNVLQSFVTMIRGSRCCWLHWRHINEWLPLTKATHSVLSIQRSKGHWKFLLILPC